MKIASLMTALMILGLSASVAKAQGGVEVGFLTCRLTETSNLIVYSKESFQCEFQPNSASPDFYVGQIKSFGANLQLKSDTTLVWGVIAPTNFEHSPGSLRGTYVGGSGEASFIGGVGAKVLVGGSGNTISLQPVSISGITGVGANVGIQSFELK